MESNKLNSGNSRVVVVEMNEDTCSTTASSASISSHQSRLSGVSVNTISEQRREIDRLKQLNAYKDLIIQEKELEMENKQLEIRRKNIELKKQELQLQKFRRNVDGLEYATEAAEFNEIVEACQSSLGLTDGHPTGGLEEQKTPGGPQTSQKINCCTPLEGAENACLPPAGGMPLPWACGGYSAVGDIGIHFSGKEASEYPAYRHRLLMHFRELRWHRPDLLLHWVENTIEGQAKRYVRNAFAVMDPGEACDVIWNTLEEVYGQKNLIVENAVKQVKRSPNSVGHDRKILLEFRADLRNLMGVVMSVNQASTLKSPQLLGQLYCAFNEKLRSRFDALHPPDRWSFEHFTEFLTAEILYIDSLHSMQVDLKETNVRYANRFTPSQAIWSKRPFSLPVAGVVEEVQKPNTKQTGFAEQCCLHSDGKAHSLVKCRMFSNMSVTERWKVAKHHRLCFMCLGKNHGTRQCKSNQKCTQCDRLHHQLLHQSPQLAPSDKGNKQDEKNEETLSDDAPVLGYVERDNLTTQVGIMKLKTVARYENEDDLKYVTFYAAVDTGATHTLCSRELAEQLFGFWHVEAQREYKMFNGDTMLCDIMQSDLYLDKMNCEGLILNSVTFIDKKLPFAHYLPEESDLPKRIDMILGGDFAWKHLFIDSKLTWSEEENCALHELGMLWLRAKTSDIVEGDGALASLKTPLCSKVRLAPDDRQFDLEKLECDPLYWTVNDNKLAMSINDEKVLKGYQETVQEVQLANGETHLQFNLPWSCKPDTMQNNYEQAKSALITLQRKLKGNEDLRTKYCEKIDAAIKNGHLVLLPDAVIRDEMRDLAKPRYYIPHFNTGQAKFRVVYDAAREYRGVSLNKLLERGPIFMQSLRSILLRFGEQKYGIAADIANMFFQIRIAPEDRDMLRILWFSGPGMQGEVAAYQFQVAPYGLRCIPSIAGYALLYTAEKNIPNVSQTTADRVSRDMFVDDLLTGANTVEEGQHLISEISQLLSSTGFKLTKWCASDELILQNVSEEDQAPSIRSIQGKDLETGTSKAQKTLGLVWDSNSDKMYMRVPETNIEQMKQITKRQAVSITHQLFDPLGWWTPLYIQTNLCCSKIARQVSEWDSLASPELTKEFAKAIKSLPAVAEVSLPRKRIPVYSEEKSQFEYHVFADSSKDVAAAVVYLRTMTGGKCDVNLVASKTSIFSQAELFRGSIPRKELIALDLAARLLRECLDSTTLPISNFEVWSDSQAVINWCSNKSLELRVFERNRVDLILRNTEGKLPKYVPTKLNPADVATRGCHPDQTERWKLWTRGPSYLYELNNDFKIDCNEQLPTEMPVSVLGTVVEISEDRNEPNFLHHVLERTSKLSKAVSVIRSVYRCCRLWKKKAGINRIEEFGGQEESDFRKSRLALVRLAQNECFDDVLVIMKSGSTFQESVMRLDAAKREPWMYAAQKFVPFLDCDGILRVGGRFDYADEFSDEQKHPAFLPKQHRVTELFIFDRHQKLAHRAAESVFASLNNDLGLRVIGGPQSVRNYLKSCFICKVLKKKRAEQLMSPLPQYRVAGRQPVFASVSIDYAGPYEIKRGRSKEKRWICLFVCHATSAVRIEIVESLEATAFLNALKRFLCLTGDKTRLIRSDCATTFIGARNILQKEYEEAMRLMEKSPEVQKWSKEREISWDFSTPASSHHQGFVERQIRSFKEVTWGVLGPGYLSRVPTDFELLTLCREAELVMNSKPLGRYLGDEENVQPLRPIDLMTGYMTPSNQGALTTPTSKADKFRKGHDYTKKLANEWWDRWQAVYLPQLQSRQKWTVAQQNIQKGDAVLLIDETTPLRGKYPFAVVVDTKTCADGLVRSATVKTSDGLIRQRDIRKLVLLEPVA